MATKRKLSELFALLADNTTGDISPQDIRDSIKSVYGGWETTQITTSISLSSDEVCILASDVGTPVDIQLPVISSDDGSGGDYHGKLYIVKNIYGSDVTLKIGVGDTVIDYVGDIAIPQGKTIAVVGNNLNLPGIAPNQWEIIFSNLKDSEVIDAIQENADLITTLETNVDTISGDLNSHEGDSSIHFTEDPNWDSTYTTVSASSATWNIGTRVDQKYWYTNAGTGIVYDEGLSIVSAGVSTFDVGVVKGFVNSNASVSASYVYVDFAGLSGITPTGFSSSATKTYIGLSATNPTNNVSTGTLVQQTTPFTNSQQREIIMIGRVIHPNFSTIDVVVDRHVLAYQLPNQINDVAVAVGDLNIEGNVYSTSGADLSIQRSAGKLFSIGSNYHNDNNDPNCLTFTSETPLVFKYRYSDNVEATDNISYIIPNVYESTTGTSGTVPSQDWTVQRIYLFQSGRTRVQFGQATYNKKEDAIKGITSEDFDVASSISDDAIARSILVVRGGATDLSNPNDAIFYEVSKFGSATESIGSDSSSLQTVYNNSTNPEFVTDTTRNGIQFKQGVGTSDQVIWVNSVAGSATGYWTGDGALSASSVSANGKAIYGVDDGATDLVSTWTSDKINTEVTNVRTDVDTISGDLANHEVDSTIHYTSATMMGVVGTINKNPTGIKDRTESNINFDDGTRTFTISATGSTFDVYIHGTKHEKTSDSIVIPDTEGLHHIYYNESGVLETTLTFTEDIIYEYVYVVNIYWDATNKLAVIMGDERHGMYMSPETHSYLHNTVGTAFQEGLTLGNINSDGTGDDNANATFSVSNGVVRDEDIVLTITDGLPQTLSPIILIPVMYKEGATGTWRKQNATNYPVRTTGSGRLAYNEFTGAVWQQTEIANNDFGLAHIFATNSLTEPIVAVQGQGDYLTLSQAREGANVELTNLVTDGLAFQEYVPIATIIFQTSNGYSNDVKSRIRSTDTGGDYIDWRETTIGSTGVATNDHGALTGLLDDDHLQYVLANGTRSMDSLSVTGNISTSGTVDGRDVSTDGTKLDGLYTTVNTTSGDWQTGSVQIDAPAWTPNTSNVHGLGVVNYSTSFYDTLDFDSDTEQYFYKIKPPTSWPKVSSNKKFRYRVYFVAIDNSPNTKTVKWDIGWRFINSNEIINALSFTYTTTTKTMISDVYTLQVSDWINVDTSSNYNAGLIDFNITRDFTTDTHTGSIRFLTMELDFLE